MSNEDPLHQNIRRTTAHHALKQVRVLVDKANAEDESKAHALRWMMRYGWVVLLIIAALIARFTGVI
jgi:putative copper export protein